MRIVSDGEAAKFNRYVEAERERRRMSPIITSYSLMPVKGTSVFRLVREYVRFRITTFVPVVAAEPGRLNTLTRIYRAVEREFLESNQPPAALPPPARRMVS